MSMYSYICSEGAIMVPSIIILPTIAGKWSFLCPKIGWVNDNKFSLTVLLNPGKSEQAIDAILVTCCRIHSLKT